MATLLVANVSARCVPAQSVATGPPATEVRDVIDIYHGVKVTDPYRWLEEDDDPDVVRWSDAQNAYARSILDNLPGVAAIRERITAIMSDESPTYGRVSFRGGKYFVIKQQPPKQQPLLVVLDALDSLVSERVVVDPNVIDDTGGTTIDWYVASPDGKLVAVSMSVGGSEAGDVHLFEVASGRDLGEVVPQANSGTAGGDLAWSPDSKGFFYTRHPYPGERPAEDMGFYQQVFFHRLGTAAKDDRYEIGRDFPRIAEIQLEVDERTGRLLATVQHGDGGEFALFLRHTDGKWQQFADFDDRIVQAAFGPRDDLFLISHVDAPRGKVEHIEIAELGQANARTIVPEGEDAIVTSFFGPSTLVPTKGRLYLVYQLGGPTEVRAYTHDGQPAAAPQQQPLSNVFELEPLAGDDLLFGSVSYLEPEAFFVFRAAAGSTSRTALAKKSPVNMSDAEVVREFATSKDGTRVPVNIIRRKGRAQDGSGPALATGYGGYGVSIAPDFSALSRVLLDNGFAVAVANIRGGGEFGKRWHLEGNLTNKQNVFDDFYAAMRHLVERKYTSPERLAIMGGSNGGLLMGAMLTQHPSAMRAVVSYVGIYDMLRVELSPNGAFNVTEFGTVKNPDHFRAMLAYSPYAHVEMDRCYPAVLMLTGANDPRVEPMQSRKMIARLQSAQACDRPILLRTSGDTGHGQGTPLAEQIAQMVDVYAFLFSELGVVYKAEN
jgi:prolyl oligopeptidase